MIYDNDAGLFKQILKQSSIMKGSYHVSPNSGNDLNTSNLETYVKDPANGLMDLKKYPMCVCMTPRSRVMKQPGGEFEQFIFNLYFLTTTYRNSDNSVKLRDADTGQSAHHVWYDWQDMKTCAMNFVNILDKVIRTKYTVINYVPTPLKMYLSLDKANVIYNRLTKFYNDSLSGVGLTFTIMMQALQCDQDEYLDIDSIIIPSPIIHDDGQ